MGAADATSTPEINLLQYIILFILLAAVLLVIIYAAVRMIFGMG